MQGEVVGNISQQRESRATVPSVERDPLYLECDTEH